MTNHKFKNSIIVALMMTPNKKGLLFFKKTCFFAAILLVITACVPSEKEPTTTTSDYQLTPIPFNQVDLADDFWLPRLKTQKETLVPFALDKTRPAVENLKKAGRFLQGDTTDLPFPHRYISSDLYKVMEGAALLLMENPAQAVERSVNSAEPTALIT
jgi:hypothetical protein